MAEPKWISDEIKNKYDNSPFRIPLRNRSGVIVEYALVDEDDFEKVNKYKWHLSNGYACGTIEKKKILLHHFVFKKPTEANVIDHINQDKLNDEKLNLREASISENNHNKKKNTTIETSSKFKGVSWNKNAKKWKSQCSNEKKEIYLGAFDSEEEAAKQYDIYTFKIRGIEANNNNLVKYEDTLEVNIDKLIKKHSNKYDLPKNIHFEKTKKIYRALKSYKTKTYKGIYRETIDEALEDLEQINKEIELIKQIENDDHNKKEITRNNKGIPYIKVKDLEVLVDENKWHEFSSMSWNIKKGYIYNKKDGFMHRIVMKANDNEIVDHINNIIYDNRCCNLRIASAGLNNHNRTKSKNASSKYFGVSLITSYKKWRSAICFNGETFRLGTFEDEIDAAKAYNKKAIELYGDNANLNIFN
jgi:hypothetical protein